MTAELDELIETRRVELGSDPVHLIQHACDVMSVYAIRDLVAHGLINVRRGGAELAPVSGSTTRTIKVQITRSLDGALELLAEHAGLSIHATLRALIVAGSMSVGCERLCCC
jgi:hypothetical protein